MSSNSASLPSPELRREERAHSKLMRGQWLVHLTALKHLIWAYLLFVYPANVGEITALVMLVRLFGSTTLLAWVYVAVSLGIVATMVPNRTVAAGKLFFAQLLLGVAQQFLLTVSAAGSALAISQGAYLDDTVVPWPHIAGDQDVYILLALLHPLALLQAFAPGWWGRLWTKAQQLWRRGLGR